MKQGSIWMVDFDPSKGHEYRKQRPALIISSNQVLKYSNLVTVMPITSNSDNCINDDIKILRDAENGLYTDSIIKVCHISSFDKSNGRFLKKIGSANEYIIDVVRRYLKKHFSLD